MSLRPALLLLALALLACPSLKKPERGVELRFATKPGARLVVDRRLASLQLRARVSEDADTLSVRIPEGEDATNATAVLTVAAKLELCPEDEARATAWCERQWPAGVSTERLVDRCAVTGATAAALTAALGDSKDRVATWFDGHTAHLYAVGAPCLAPRVIEGGARADPQLGKLLKLTLDDDGTHALAQLTTQQLHRRVVILLDGAALSVPVVQEPVRDGKLTVPAPPDRRESVLINALVGGAIEGGLELRSTSRYGPPSL